MKKSYRIALSVLTSVLVLVSTAWLVPVLQTFALTQSELDAMKASIDADSQAAAAASEALAAYHETQDDADVSQAQYYADELARVQAMKASVDSAYQSYNKEVAASQSASVSESESVSASESESASVSESESISESESLSISESESVSESESISESEEEEAKRIFVGDYEVITELENKVKAPDGFIIAKDDKTFGKETQAFYSTSFKRFVYYCELDGKDAMYVYDSMNETMFPYVSFKDGDGNSYMVITPEQVSELPDEVVSETTVNMSAVSSKNALTFVPGWEVKNSDGTTSVIVYLLNSQGEKAFYEYTASSGKLSIAKWTTDSADESEEESEEETEEEEQETESKKTSGSLQGYMIWLIIIGIIIILLVIAIIVVYRMSRKQDDEENRMDYDDTEEFVKKVPVKKAAKTREPKEDTEDQISGGSDYVPNNQPGPAPFDVNFENAFPEEMGVSEEKAEEEDPSGDPEDELQISEEKEETVKPAAPEINVVVDGRTADDKAVFDADFEPDDLLGDPKPVEQSAVMIDDDGVIDISGFEEIKK